MTEKVKTPTGFETDLVDIADISPGDTVTYDGRVVTVGKKDIRRDEFMGISLFGDNHRSGTVKVERHTTINDLRFKKEIKAANEKRNKSKHESSFEP